MLSQLSYAPTTASTLTLPPRLSIMQPSAGGVPNGGKIICYPTPGVKAESR